MDQTEIHNLQTAVTSQSQLFGNQEKQLQQVYTSHQVIESVVQKSKHPPVYIQTPMWVMWSLKLKT